MHTQEQQVSVRIKQAAEEFWPIVKGEKRGNGKPIFPDLQSLISNLSRAFRNGLISGEKNGPRTTWVNREDALNYLTRYVETAKASTSTKIFMGSRRAGPPVSPATTASPSPATCPRARARATATAAPNPRASPRKKAANTSTSPTTKSMTSSTRKASPSASWSTATPPSKPWPASASPSTAA